MRVASVPVHVPFGDIGASGPLHLTAPVADHLPVHVAKNALFRLSLSRRSLAGKEPNNRANCHSGDDARGIFLQIALLRDGVEAAQSFVDSTDSLPLTDSLAPDAGHFFRQLPSEGGLTDDQQGR